MNSGNPATVLVLLLGILAGPAASATTPPANPGDPRSASPTTSTGTVAASKPAQPIQIRDQNGKPISYDQFTAAVKGGQRYTTRKDMQAARLILVLLPPGVNTPGSMSWADMTQASRSFTMLSINGVHYKVVFHDEHGEVIDQPAFAAGVPKHQRYITQLDKEKGTAILTLLPIGVNKPGSQPTSIWTPESETTQALIPKPGTRFVDFDLPKVGGGRINSASLGGKPYVVDFFFADCLGCIAELPVLNTYHKQYPARQVFALTFDDAKTAAGFVKQRHFDWPVAYNGKAFTDKLGIKVYPTMVVVGADGKVLATRVGENTSATPESLENWITVNISRSRKPSDTH